jgi:hypothetical protein
MSSKEFIRRDKMSPSQMRVYHKAVVNYWAQACLSDVLMLAAGMFEDGNLLLTTGDEYDKFNMPSCIREEWIKVSAKDYTPPIEKEVGIPVYQGQLTPKQKDKLDMANKTCIATGSRYRAVGIDAYGDMIWRDKTYINTIEIKASFINPDIAVNNHHCPSCNNDRVSKNEKSCWKCGGSL